MFRKIELNKKTMSEEKQIGQTKKCPKCQEEVLKGAKKCKHCGSDLRNWFMKHKVISAFLILMFIGILSGGSNPNNTNNGQTVNGIQNDTKAEEKTGKINETISVGNFSYRVQKAEQAQSVGNQYINHDASGVYEIISLTLRNNDKESRYADSNMFKLIDDQDRSFVVSTEATSAYSIANNNQYDLFLKQVNPGLEIGGVLIFDIPKDAKGLKLETSGGFGSPEKAYIELN